MTMADFILDNFSRGNGDIKGARPSVFLIERRGIEVFYMRNGSLVRCGGRQVDTVSEAGKWLIGTA